VAAVGDAVGDGVGLAVELDALGLVFELVAEQAQQRRDPLLAGFGGGGDFGRRVSSLRWKMRQ
jgi:hypothetical protein